MNHDNQPAHKNPTAWRDGKAALRDSLTGMADLLRGLERVADDAEPTVTYEPRCPRWHLAAAIALYLTLDLDGRREAMECYSHVVERVAEREMIDREFAKVMVKLFGDDAANGSEAA